MLPAGLLPLALALSALRAASAAPISAPDACSRMDRPIVAEVFYDATGDDTGHEFVELLNPSATPCSLVGLRLEAGDGAAPGRWTLRWTGTAADSIAGSGRFVIGGSLVLPPPGATVTLDLQNGPDAVRLVWPDGVTEVVGYGTRSGPFESGLQRPGFPGVAAFSGAREPIRARSRADPRLACARARAARARARRTTLGPSRESRSVAPERR